MEYQKECIVGNMAQILMKSPTTCTKTHDRACQRCWEKHLSSEVEMMEEGGVRCMFCLVEMDREDVVRLARKGTVERYDALLQASEMDLRKYLQCPDRCLESRIEPAFGKSSRWQPHDPEVDGRIFICKFCDKQTCVPCDRPEHFGQPCAGYRLSVLNTAQHTGEEDASAELMAKLPTCPACEQPYEHGGGCAYFQCGKCKHRFCGECQVPWVGPRGEYELGRLAHEEGCKFRKEDPHPDHSYRRSDAEAVVAVVEGSARLSRVAMKRAIERIGTSKIGEKRKREEGLPATGQSGGDGENEQSRCKTWKKTSCFGKHGRSSGEEAGIKSEKPGDA